MLRRCGRVANNLYLFHSRKQAQNVGKMVFFSQTGLIFIPFSQGDKFDLCRHGRSSMVSLMMFYGVTDGRTDGIKEYNRGSFFLPGLVVHIFRMRPRSNSATAAILPNRLPAQTASGSIRFTANP